MIGRIVALSLAAILLGSCGAAAQDLTLSASSIRAAFIAKGIPIVPGRAVRFGVYRAKILEVDPKKLVTPHSIRSEFLVIYVLPSTESRIAAMRKPEMRTFLDANGLKVIARENVIVTLLRKSVSSSYVARIRAALAAAK